MLLNYSTSQCVFASYGLCLCNMWYMQYVVCICAVCQICGMCLCTYYNRAVPVYGTGMCLCNVWYWCVFTQMCSWGLCSACLCAKCDGTGFRHTLLLKRCKWTVIVAPILKYNYFFSA